MDDKNNVPEKKEKQKITGAEKKQHGLFKKRRGGIVLTKDEVKEIKAGRKKLRKDMKAQGIKSRKEFELTASGLGLYFDKNRFLALLLWLFGGRLLWFLLGSLAAFFAAMYAFSMISQMRGHFTINMTKDLFKEGFTMSETVGFEHTTSHLYSDPVYDAPELTIVDIPEDIDGIDGSHNGEKYFAYTFYVRNEGDSTVGYDYQLRVNSESLNLSKAAWVMLFEDGEMRFYARAKDDGTPETAPPRSEQTNFFIKAPFIDVAQDADDQYEVVAERGEITYYRAVAFPFESDTVVTSGRREGVVPMEPHKYTVVIWLEGNDEDCTDELIGGHIGLEMNFKLIDEDEYE